MIHRTTDLAAAHCDAPVWFEKEHKFKTGSHSDRVFFSVNTSLVLPKPGRYGSRFV